MRGREVLGWDFGGKLLSQGLQTRLSSEITEIFLDVVMSRQNVSQQVQLGEPSSHGEQGGTRRPGG